VARSRFPLVALTAAVAVGATVAGLGVACGAEVEQAGPPTSVEVATSLPSAPGAEVAGVTEERPTVDAALEERLRSAVLSVDSQGCGFDRQGTVSLVDLAGSPLAMSNRHVLAGATDAVVTLPDGGVVSLRVGGSVPDRDAAVLDPQDALATGLVAAALPVGPAPRVGEDVVVAGHPGGVFAAVSGRVIAVEDRVDDGGTVQVLVVDVPTAEGSSGGVVVDASGRAVGLVAARDPETGSAVAYPFSALTGRLDPEPPGC
jgi:S1-C subfamily serine protease